MAGTSFVWYNSHSRLMRLQCLFYISSVNNLTVKELAGGLDLVHTLGVRMQGVPLLPLGSGCGGNEPLSQRLE